MTKREACPRSAGHGVVWSVVLMGVLAGCADPGPRLQLQVPRPPRTQSGLGAGTAPSVPATATFDAPLVDPQSWSGSPIGTGSFSVALTPTASGGPTSIAFTDPQGGDRYVLVGDFSAASGHGLALLSDTAWVVGANPLNGTTRAALVFDIASGDVVGVARTGTITLTAAGSALGQRVTGTLSASFVPYSPTQPACVIDADCASGEVCQGGQCVRSPPSGCTSSAQCPAGQQCQSGACVQPPAQDAGPAPGCATDRDCSSNERCVSGQCVATTPACTSSAQCGAGQACVSGQCVATTPACASSAQCGAGQVCVSGQCVATTPACTSSAQCPRGQVCQAGACTASGPTSCAPKQGSGGYSGTWGAVNTCSALGNGAVSLASAAAAIDDDNGQLALFIVNPATQRDGVVIELNACPAGPGATNGLQAALYTSQQTTQGVVLSAMVPGTAAIQWTQVGATLAGTVTVTFAAGGAVSGTFSVQ